jgi:hypothetical protein
MRLTVDPLLVVHADGDLSGLENSSNALGHLLPRLKTAVPATNFQPDFQLTRETRSQTREERGEKEDSDDSFGATLRR